LFKLIEKTLKSQYGVSCDSLRLKTRDDYDIFQSNSKIVDVLEPKQEIFCFPAKGQQTPNKNKKRKSPTPAGPQTDGDKPKTSKLSEGEKTPASKAAKSATTPGSTTKPPVGAVAVNVDKTKATPAKPNGEADEGEDTPSSSKRRRKRGLAAANDKKDAKDAADEGNDRKRRKVSTDKGDDNKQAPKGAKKQADKAPAAKATPIKTPAANTSAVKASAANAGTPAKSSAGKDAKSKPAASKSTHAKFKAESIGDVNDVAAIGRVIKKGAVPDAPMIKKAITVLFEGKTKTARDKFPVKKLHSMVSACTGAELAKETKKIIFQQRKEILGGN